MREGEIDEVHKRLTTECGVDLRAVNASKKFLARLRDVEDPEKKRHIIGNTFVEVRFKNSNKRHHRIIRFFLSFFLRRFLKAKQKKCLKRM